MTEHYLDILSKLEENYAIMKAMRPLPKEGINYFIEEMGITVTHSSNALEGNTFTFDETRLLLEKGITTTARTFHEHEEIVGYKSGYDFLYIAAKQNQLIDEDFIKKIHSCVMHGKDGAGQYRTIQNYVGSLTKVVYVPPTPSQVVHEMKDYVANVQSDLEQNRALFELPKIDWEKLFHTLALHHIEFEKIHPFIDGNGRTGRLLLTYELLQMGLLPIDIQVEERARYDAALKHFDVKKERSTRPESKTEKMANLFAECELESMIVWNKIFAEYKMVQSFDVKVAPKKEAPATKPRSPRL